MQSKRYHIITAIGHIKWWTSDSVFSPVHSLCSIGRIVSLLQAQKHQPALIRLLCDELKAKEEQILDFDLMLADTQPAVSLEFCIWAFILPFLAKNA